MNHYKLLKLDTTCDFKEVKRAYFRQAKLCHPDLFNNAKDKEEEFKRLVVAFDTLSDPLKRVIYDESLGVGEESQAQSSRNINSSVSFSIMDLPSDDVLEEFIVGNSPPLHAHIATLFLDLTETEVFMTFREGKNLFYSRKYSAALLLFKRATNLSPQNIIYRYYLGRTFAILGKFRKSKNQYNIAIKIGRRRIPVQNLNRIKNELNRVNKSQFPIWSSFVNLFIQEDTSSNIPDDQQMIDSANRVIEKLMKSDNDRKMLK